MRSIYIFKILNYGLFFFFALVDVQNLELYTLRKMNMGRDSANRKLLGNNVCYKEKYNDRNLSY